MVYRGRALGSMKYWQKTVFEWKQFLDFKNIVLKHVLDVGDHVHGEITQVWVHGRHQQSSFLSFFFSNCPAGPPQVMIMTSDLLQASI